MNNRRIVLISNSANPLPDSGGGSVVLYRHLVRLSEEGFDVVLVNTFNRAPKNEFFKSISISRRWWYPPLSGKRQILVRLRCYIESLEIQRQLRLRKGDIVLSILGEYLSLSASFTSGRAKVPHVLFFHDDHIFNSDGNINILSPKWYINIINRAAVIFTVSSEMNDLLAKHTNAKKVILLYPIPEGKSPAVLPVWKKQFSEGISACYAGSVFIFMFSGIETFAKALMRANGSLTIITRQYEDARIQLNALKNVSVKPLYKTLTDLTSAIAESYSVNIVFYSDDANNEIRMLSSFPSKFIEYLYIGVPILIVAPPFSTIGKWAIKNNWLAYSSTYDPEDIEKAFVNFRDKAFWELCQKQLEEIRRSQFDPNNIHAILHQELVSLAAS